MSAPLSVACVRSGLVESRHRVWLVVADARGEPVLACGPVDEPVFPRSALKPLQAAALVRHGLRLDAPLLALAAASHSGEPFHLDGVRRILAGAGLTEDALRTPAQLPLGEAAARAWLAAGRGPEPVAMNCSGKHAAMLATCVANGWPTEGYRVRAHPVQQVVRDTVARCCGEAPAAVGVDGCGAPVFALTLRGLARGFAALARAAPDSAEGLVAAAVRGYPEWASGTGRDLARLVRAVPGLLAKEGAEGVYAAALPDGRAVALKVEDGADRARLPVMVEALVHCGVPRADLAGLVPVPVLGGGQPVGELRVAPLDAPAPRYDDQVS